MRERRDGIVTSAIASPDDPGTEWDGLKTVWHTHDGGTHPGRREDCADHDEEPYRDRSPREEWVSAWRESRELHR